MRVSPNGREIVDSQQILKFSAGAERNASARIFLSQTFVQSLREHYWFFEFNCHQPQGPMGHRFCLDAQGFGQVLLCRGMYSM